MKFRLLTKEELEPLAEELKHFLIVNGIHDDEWRDLNINNPERAQELVGIFSDTVLQKVYEKIRFLEFRSPDACFVFNLNDDEIRLMAIQANTPEVDMSTPEGIHYALTNHSSQLSFFRSVKPYSDNREMEVHRMLLQGCFPSAIEFWQSLEQMIG